MHELLTNPKTNDLEFYEFSYVSKYVDKNVLMNHVAEIHTKTLPIYD